MKAPGNDDDDEEEEVEIYDYELRINLPPSSNAHRSIPSSSPSPSLSPSLSTRRPSPPPFRQPTKFPINPSLVREVLAEALGTFVLMFCIGGIVANTSLMGSVESALMGYAATAGLTVVVIVYSIGSISGAHVNPAVTIAFAAVGPFPWSKVPGYILAQVGGSILATYVGKLVYGLRPELLMTRPLHGSAAAFGIELIATFLILFLTASLLSDPQTLGPLSGFTVGVAICLGVLISGPVSGGSMNPARSLGPALVSWRFERVWIYVAAPTIGAVAGVFVYRVLRLKGWSCNNKTDPSQRTSTHTHNGHGHASFF
ncbi:probable aquaporin NIP7-1 [Andrographis paniculata]|uniref:probable aquaporin NIP7-1 n=1 Tax=Andrographis paniculata TaxID=175694 RepID=UPI0021E8DE11|nr:probable aquaporin NIP7-1 [Andrographis paniculata]